jgi:anti-sigma factor ChrR (cupin superfamily)
MEDFINIYDDLNWEDAPEYPTGTKRKVLYDKNGVKTILLNYPEGFYMDPHSHMNAEQHFILKGEYASEGKVYKEGAFRSFNAHVDHGPFESKHGALVLVIWTPHYPEE